MVVYAHTAYDISVLYNRPTQTIGNPDVESAGWVLNDPIHAYMYIGNNQVMEIVIHIINLKMYM